MRIAHARREEMAAIDKAHGGAGPVLFKSLYDKGEFQTDWCFIHSAYLLPGGGIGHHCHDRGEEIFITTEVELFLVGVCKEKSKLDVADLGDDLAKR